MDFLQAHDFTHKNGETTHYYQGGPRNGIPLIFLHGWPDLAEIWKHQLKHFSEKGFRVIAPDMRGYGGSSAPTDKRGYSLQVIVAELVEFASALDIRQAVWIAHDWGCGANNALAAHHPELFLGLVNLAIPYRTVELGLDFLKANVNRDIYPEAEYEYGQWSYMRFYELEPEKSIKRFEGHVATLTKAMYTKHDASTWGQPAPTSKVMKDGGWFGNHPEKVPDVPLEQTSLDESLYRNLLASHDKHGFFPPTAWYLNHDVNAVYAQSEKNGGVLEFPVLYIDAKYDAVCSPSTTPKFKEIQEQFAKDLMYVTVESAHWVQIERPDEVNAAVDKWLDKKIVS
ncbi:hypothetical protein ACEQ8H_005357 [Pleosporales sp. CAS-2024a]